ncbi:hypothetical protein V565_026720 [Rhizoctonia solani 123E]|uniref:Uncharacterized protein n=1 Tax=Rhizoctonia solani 123E TaxID=1423351 RepID=A0A074SA22_9AGAM|nr:hypothetical protein V565_026720 [Rhizoctonia solani 123E]
MAILMGRSMETEMVQKGSQHRWQTVSNADGRLCQQGMRNILQLVWGSETPDVRALVMPPAKHVLVRTRDLLHQLSALEALIVKKHRPPRQLRNQKLRRRKRSQMHRHLIPPTKTTSAKGLRLPKRPNRRNKK